MQHQKTLTSLSAAIILALSASISAADWGYEGDNAPENWGTLKEEFAICGSGKSQSPINIERAVDGDLDELELNYAPAGHEVLNNGHTIQVNYRPGSSMTVGGKTFNLLQFHFHTPSENTISGVSFPFEGHFVHADEDGNLAVIGLMFEDGDSNPALDAIWQNMPTEAGTSAEVETMIDASAFFDSDMEMDEYFRFSGSLTTPPCSEGVNWFVMKEYATISEEQVAKFDKVIGQNNRPVQAINARVIVE